MEWRGREEGRVDSGEVRKLGRSRRGLSSPTSVPAQQQLAAPQLPANSLPATPPNRATEEVSPVPNPEFWDDGSVPPPQHHPGPPLLGTPGCPAPRFQGRRGVALQRPATTSGKAPA